jgi:hypothetical protein
MTQSQQSILSLAIPSAPPVRASALRPRFVILALFLGLPVWLAGCGNPGTPLPPSLHIPETVADLKAARTADTVALHWTMPRRNTERLLLKGDQKAIVCRAVAGGGCTPIATVLLAAAAPAAYDDLLPMNLRSGNPCLLRYEVRLPNPSGHDAGSSNAAFAAAGAAPPALRGATAEPTARGILVKWQQTAQQGAARTKAVLVARLVRDRILQPGETATPTQAETHDGVPQPLQQVLESPEELAPVPGTSLGATESAAETGAAENGAADRSASVATGSGTRFAKWSPDHALDQQALLNRSYRYTVQLVERLTLDGHALSIDGTPAQTAIVTAQDLFPPEVPTGLVAVANADGSPGPTIDLSWTADTAADLAGYVVYRRVVNDADPGDGQPGNTTASAIRMSGSTLVAGPAWSDTTARPGVHYAYSVAAVDASGNESARSAESVEALPAQP